MAKWADVADLKVELDLRLVQQELVAALKFYANAENYIRPSHEWEDANPIEKDEGDIARAALRKLGVMK